MLTETHAVRKTWTESLIERPTCEPHVDSHTEFVTKLKNSDVDKSGENVDRSGFAEMTKSSLQSQPTDRQLDSLSRPSMDFVREQLGTSLKTLDQLKPPDGLPTGVDVLDNFLLWRGLPKGDISLFIGKPGTGATSLWLHSALQVCGVAESGDSAGRAADKWAAWINSDWSLTPGPLINRKLNLKRLLVVDKPKQNGQLFWILQEMISSSLFELIGCHLPEALLKNHQLQKLKKLARLHKVALVLVSHAKTWKINPLFSLVVECGREFFTVRRALHRPTPFVITGSPVLAEVRRDLMVVPRHYHLR